MTTSIQPMTAQDLLALPDDGFRYELVRGELRRMSPAGRKHGRLVMNLSTPLDQYVRTHQLGEVYTAETGFILATNPDLVRAPNISFVSAERASAVADEEGFFPGPPDLAVEVISPSDLYTEVDEKVRDYLDAGTHMVVIVNPRRETVTVYHSPAAITLLGTTGVLDGGDVVPGWSIAVAAIFAP